MRENWKCNSKLETASLRLSDWQRYPVVIKAVLVLPVPPGNFFPILRRTELSTSDNRRLRAVLPTGISLSFERVLRESIHSLGRCDRYDY